MVFSMLETKFVLEWITFLFAEIVHKTKFEHNWSAYDNVKYLKFSTLSLPYLGLFIQVCFMCMVMNCYSWWKRLSNGSYYLEFLGYS